MYKRAIVLFLAYLMWSENLYNDELSQMSLIMSNIAHGENITLKEKRKNYGTMNIRSYMERLGFTGIDTEELTYETDIKVRYYIGYKSIDYYSKKRGVIGIFLSTNESVEAYKKLAADLDYLRDNNLYDQIARDIYSKISTDKIHVLETEYGLDYYYWVSGKGIAGGIASEVSTIIRKEDSDFKRSNNWYTIKDIYCYTFGAPKTHIGANYTNNFIKNIINEDDYLTKVIPDDKGYRNGFTYNASVYSDFIYNYKNLIRTPKYTGNYMQMNSVKNALNTLRKDHPSVMENVNDDMSKLLSKHISGTSNEEDMKWTKNYVNTSELATEIVNQVDNKELETASSIKAYWILAKILEGLDEKTSNGRTYNKIIEDTKHEIWSSDVTRHMHENIEIIANWYIDNVSTYQAGETSDSRADAFEGDRGLYTSDILQEFYNDDKLSIDSYKTRDFDNAEYEFNNNPLMFGDDCTDFASAVFLYESNGSQKNAIEYRGNKESTKGTARDPYAGFKLHERNAQQFATIESFENAMDRLGYKKIYTENFKNGLSDLRYGDLLVCNSHVEFYIGYIYAHKRNELNPEPEWISVDSLTNEYEEYEQYFDENNNDLRRNRLYSTFGWGSVKTTYPSATNYFSLGGTRGNYYFKFANSSDHYNVIYRRDP